MSSGESLVQLIDALELSPNAATAALMRRVFWRAAASSPAALAETSSAYARLLAHAIDAAAAGRSVSRQDVRRFTGADDAQLVLWELIAEPGACLLSPTDAPALESLRKAAMTACRADDERVARLRAILGDQVPSLIFVTRRATVRYLRDRLSGSRIAWCSGSAAGIGAFRTPRASMLDWFRTDGPTHPLAPEHLVTTDVAAEGLDLSRLRRVIHYDLPWTPARVEQREGRSRRGAMAHLSTSMVIPAPASLEERLQLVAILDRKRELPRRIGLGGGDGGVWRQREQLAAELEGGAGVRGLAVIAGSAPGLIAGIEIVELSGNEEIVVGRSLACRGMGAWGDEAEAARTLRWAASQPDTQPAAGHSERRAAMEWLATGIRDLLRQHEAAAWWRRGDTTTRTLLHRLYAMMRQAGRERDRCTMALVERAIRLAGGGHTAGERMLLQSLAAADDDTLRRSLAALPLPSRGTGLLAARLSGLIIIRDGELPFPARRDTFGAHDTLRHAAVRPRWHPDQLGEADPGQLSPHAAGARHPRPER